MNPPEHEPECRSLKWPLERNACERRRAAASTATAKSLMIFFQSGIGTSPRAQLATQADIYQRVSHTMSREDCRCIHR